MKLNELKPQQGSAKRKMRVGRGIGSGKGKTSGRGQKGQKARTGIAIKGFEGGQMPLHMRMPKRGFRNVFARTLVELTIVRLSAALESKQIDPKAVIDEDALVKAGVIRRKKDGVRLIGTGDLKAKVDLKLTGGATKGAIAAVEKAGGKIEIVAPPKAAPKAEGKGAAKKAARAKEAAKKPPRKKAE